MTVPLIDVVRPPGGFACIVADYPWSFSDKGHRGAPERAPGGRYKTVPFCDLILMGEQVQRLAAKDAVLFLWVPPAFMVSGQGADAARSCGFVPKTEMAWVKCRRPRAEKECKRGDKLPYPKLQIGLGHYTRAAHEPLILAVRGRPKILDHSIPAAFFAGRTVHSKKPEKLQTIAEKLCEGPRLELFARRHRAGWLCWGDQLQEGPTR
jgi:N6-adenosine-specific RNA methylase IME4